MKHFILSKSFDMLVYNRYTAGMNFEYDPSKSVGNKDKHGIDFEEAKALWDDYNRLEVPAVGERNGLRL